MKTITYNPAIALSILYAAALSNKYQGAELKASSKAPDLEKVMQKEGEYLDRYAVNLLKEGGERGEQLEYGITGSLHDLSDFTVRAKLINIYGNDKFAAAEAIEDGKLIQRYNASPGSTGKLKKAGEISVDGPVTDITKPTENAYDLENVQVMPNSESGEPDNELAVVPDGVDTSKPHALENPNEEKAPEPLQDKADEKDAEDKSVNTETSDNDVSVPEPKAAEPVKEDVAPIKSETSKSASKKSSTESGKK